MDITEKLKALIDGPMRRLNNSLVTIFAEHLRSIWVPVEKKRI